MIVKKSLFREEVEVHRFYSSFGTVRMNIPINYRRSACYAVAIMLALFLFFYYAQLSEQILIRGYIDTERGIIAIESQEVGMIKRVAIEEGELVHKNQELFLLKNSNPNLVKSRINHLKDQLAYLTRECQIKKDYYESLHKLHTQNYIATVDLKRAESDLLELKRQVKEAVYELTQTQASQTYSIKAPSDGIVTNIMYRTGQHISSEKVLAQLIPQGARFIARLYIPTRHRGFLKTGQKVNLKYDAYPSHRFGFYGAQIKEINQTVLTDDKEDKPLHIGEPYYKIKASLLQSYISVYGNKLSLTHGMTFTAILCGEKKTIWRWVMDPIYSYYGEHPG